MAEQMNLQALVDKISWEGGVGPAVEYGIAAAHIEDKEIARAWAAFASAYQEICDILDAKMSEQGVEWS